MSNHNKTIKKQMKGVKQELTNSHNEKLYLIPTARCQITPSFGGDDMVMKRTSNYFTIPEPTYPPH